MPSKRFGVNACCFFLQLDNQVAGYAVTYAPPSSPHPFQFITVKGSGHMVTLLEASVWLCAAYASLPFILLARTFARGVDEFGTGMLAVLSLCCRQVPEYQPAAALGMLQLYLAGSVF